MVLDLVGGLAPLVAWIAMTYKLSAIGHNQHRLWVAFPISNIKCSGRSNNWHPLLSEEKKKKKQFTNVMTFVILMDFRFLPNHNDDADDLTIKNLKKLKYI